MAFPFERRYRERLALLVTNQALAFGQPADWMAAASHTLRQALIVDHSGPDLLAYLVSVELARNQDAAAKPALHQFRLVARASPLAHLRRNRP